MCHMIEFAFLQLSHFFLSLEVTSASGSLPVSSWQKYAHVRQAQRGSKPYYTSLVWWCGVLLMGIGELGNFAAYGFAPASLIAPLGCVSVIGESDLFFSPLLIHYQCSEADGKVTSSGNNGTTRTYNIEFVKCLTFFIFMLSSYVTQTLSWGMIITRRADVSEFANYLGEKKP